MTEAKPEPIPIASLAGIYHDPDQPFTLADWLDER